MVRSSEGRLRVHLPHWSGKGTSALAAAIRRLPGVRKVEPNPITGNVLILFHPRQTNADQLWTGLQDLRLDGHSAAEPARHSAPTGVIHEGTGRHRRARIPIRGLGRDAGLARRVVAHLEGSHGVRARPIRSPAPSSSITTSGSSMSKTWSPRSLTCHCPLCRARTIRSTHWTRARCVRSATRAIGSVLGLGFVTMERLLFPGIAGHHAGAVVAGLVHMVQGLPAVQDRLRRVLGENGATIASHGVAIVALAAADIPLGLVLAGAEALLLLNAVTQRRAAWRRYEDGLDASSATVAGAVIRLEPGMRVPFDARVVEGTGTAFGRSGRLLSLSPGLRAPAGARLAGGPFVLELLGSAPAVVRPRPAEPALDAYRHYLRVAAPFSFASAAVVGLATGSVLRGFEALMMLNPRPATVGMEAANLGASGRALRAGLTFVGSRPKHVLRRPDVLLLDGPRLLSDGKEVDRVLPLAAGMDSDHLLTLASAVAVATGAPLGKALIVPGPLPATDGVCDGRAASAHIQGVRYTLVVGGSTERQQLATTGLVLVLSREDAAEPLGLIGLRPKLLPGIAHLIKVCRRHGVELAVLPGRDATAARRITDRAGVPLLAVDDAVEAIRSRQARGLRVAFASDGGNAAQAFADCDLAIGMAAGHTGYFPGQADLLAPDLLALADVIDTGARRDRAVRDGVVLATLSNAVGLALSLQGPIGLAAAFIPGYVAALVGMGVSWLHLRGGDRPEAALGYLSDPRPERWGHASVAAVFRAFQTAEAGLSSAAAAHRHRSLPRSLQREEYLAALGHQLQSPTLALLAGGACLTLVLGQPLNTIILSASLSIGLVVALWQEREVSRTRHALQHLRDPQAQRPARRSAGDAVRERCRHRRRPGPGGRRACGRRCATRCCRRSGGQRGDGHERDAADSQGPRRDDGCPSGAAGGQRRYRRQRSGRRRRGRASYPAGSDVGRQ